MLEKADIFQNEQPALAALRKDLFATGIWPFRWQRQTRALRALLNAQEPEAVDILVSAVSSDHRLSSEIRTALATRASPVRMNRLWHLWAEKRPAWLGELLCAQGQPAQAPDLAVLSLLKLRRAVSLSTDALMLDQVLPYLADEDADVRETSEVYLRQMGMIAPHLYLAALLVLSRFGDIGSSREAMRGVLSLELDSDGLENARRLYLTHLPRAEFLFTALLTAPTELPLTRKQAWELVPFFADADEDVRAGAEAYLQALYEKFQAVGMRLDLKLGRIDRLPTGHLSASSVLNALSDADPDVRAGVRAYAARLPCEPALNDLIFAAWSHTTDEGLAEVIRSQQRMPTQAVKAAIFAAAGDEDALVEACRPLGVADLLELAAHWAASERRPTDPRRRQVVEQAIAAQKLVGPLTFDPPVVLPAGLTDFFDWWEAQPAADEALSHARTAADPLTRAGAAWVSHLYGALQPDDLARMGASADWPERLVTRMIDVGHAQPDLDHVQNAHAVEGLIDTELHAATAGGAAAGHDRLLRLRDACAGRTDRAGCVNRGLADLLLAFQDYFMA